MAGRQRCSTTLSSPVKDQPSSPPPGEPTRGLEPLTARLQVGSATNCATSAGHENKSRDKDRDHARDDSHHGEGWSRQITASVSGAGSLPEEPTARAVIRSRRRPPATAPERQAGPHMTTLTTWLTGWPGSLAATLTCGGP